MILIALLIALAALTIWVASRNNWEWRATLAALAAAGAAVWAALWKSINGGGAGP